MRRKEPPPPPGQCLNVYDTKHAPRHEGYWIHVGVVERAVSDALPMFLRENPSYAYRRHVDRITAIKAAMGRGYRPSLQHAMYLLLHGHGDVLDEETRQLAHDWSQRQQARNRHVYGDPSRLVSTSNRTIGRSGKVPRHRRAG